MARVRTTELNAILSEEFDQLLDILEVREQFERGAYQCENCRAPITHNNVVMVFPLPDREVGFLCAKAGCGLEVSVVS